MTFRRALMLMTLLVLAACSSPTGPRLPDPGQDGRKPAPPKQGVHVVGLDR
ncbi:MAG TPA: hypothetical protein VLH75_16245 [Longimicrobiales bacterium]|nr:hypothetical protein [Longimicrobiales bacterium]